MASNNIEIEVKYLLQNALKVQKFLDNNAKKTLDKAWQNDTYYTPAHKNFLAVEFPFQWLRLRESKKGVQINYKHFHPENVEKNDYCDELETSVGDIVIKKIMDNLDFVVLAKVSKKRSSWLYKGVEVSIDWIEELGTFIEIEAMEGYTDMKEAKSMLVRVLSEIGAKVGEEIHMGYPSLILTKGL